MTIKATAKTAVRKLTRLAGYDLVPFAAGLAKVQRDLLGHTPVAIDVGANVGQYAERLRDLGFGGKIVSFEPGSDAFATLSAKADREGGRWDARRLALGSDAGEAVLRVSRNSVSSSLLDVAEEHLRAAPASSTAKQETVGVSSLDIEMAAETQSPFWLKIDTQGFEMPVLRGATETLRRTLAVQAEVSFTHLYDGQTDWLELCEFLQRAGFTLRYLEPGYEDHHTGYMLQADVLFVQERLLG